MKYKVDYAMCARADLKHLDYAIAQRIIKKIAFFAAQESPLHFAKPLKNAQIGNYRFRIGDYRAIFDIDKKGRIQILMILRVKHRKDIYGL